MRLLIAFFVVAAYIVRGMMYYRRALMLQSFLERRSFGGIQFLDSSDILFLLEGQATDILHLFHPSYKQRKTILEVLSPQLKVLSSLVKLEHKLI